MQQPCGAHLSHELSVDLGHPIDGPGSLNTEVRGWVPGRGGAESPDRARDEQSQLVFCRNIQNVVQS